MFVNMKTQKMFAVENKTSRDSAVLPDISGHSIGPFQGVRATDLDNIGETGTLIWIE